MEELAQLETLDNGKPLAPLVPLTCRWRRSSSATCAGWATKLEGNTISLSVPICLAPSSMLILLREPLGVVGQIIPWNFPLLMAAWKLGPALATETAL